MSAKTDNFINKNKRASIIEGVRNKIPPSITLAQAILESGWGESGLSVNANNYFGIKADSSWKGEIYNADTHEYYNGVLTYTSDYFRAYKNPLESFKDHSIFLHENPRYSNLFDLDFLDYKGWAHGLKRSGYATSPTYAEKLINLIEQYDLNEFDKKAKSFKNLGYIGLVILIAIFTILLIKKFKK
jgi:flagellum-specific peptidoglycan hydrolase FlgJ